MKFKRLVASFLMGATLVSGVSVPVIFADTNTYASTFAEINYSSSQVNMDGIKAFVTRMYKVCLDREPEEDGLNGWAQKLAQKEATGCSVAYGFVFSPEFIGKNPTNEAFVNYMYDAFFGRTPDEGGFKYWVDLLNNGASKEFVFCGFANSQEFSNLCNNYGVVRGFHIEGEDFNRIALINLFVERLYNVVLNRTCDEVGMPGWTVKLNSHEESGCSVAYGFVFSPEFINRHTCNDCYVEILYNAFLGRSSDTEGKASWVSMLNEGKSRELVFNGFAGSLEFAGICSEYGIEPGSLSTEGTTHAEGTCTICGNSNSNGSSNGGATNNGGSTSGNDSSNNGSTNGSSSTGSGSSNNGTSNGGVTSGNGGSSSGTNGSGTTNNGGSNNSSTNNGSSNSGSNNNAGNSSTVTPSPSPEINGINIESGAHKYIDLHEASYADNGIYTADDFINKYKDDYKNTMLTFYSNNDYECYYLDENGNKITGWVNFIKNDKFEGTMYFDKETGAAYRGWHTIDGVERYFMEDFDESGVWFLAEGPQFCGNNEYCFFIDGIKQPRGFYKDKYDDVCYVDETGSIVRDLGWITIDGATYYSRSYEILTGFKNLDGKDYLFDEDGKLQTQSGFAKVNNRTYYIKSDGTVQKGWLELDGKKYYFDQKYGYMKTGISTADDKLCQFADDGVFQKYLTGWVQDESLYFNIIYYADSDSVFYTGWHEIDGKTYYFDSIGWMAINGTKQIGSDCYIFDSEGQYLTGWYESYTRTYYLGTDGKARSGFQTIDGKRYYFTSDGVWGSADYLQTGFFEVNKDLYYADEDGVLQTGWKKVDGNWYYFDKSTNKAIKNAFVESGDYEYHLDENGVMSIGWVKVVKDNKTYWYYCKETPHSDSDKGDKGSVMKNTWRKISGSWYYFDADGVMVTGWLDFKGDWYYLNPAVGNSEGKMLTGAQTINGAKYYFYTKADEDVYEGASEGAMAKNVTINGITYGANGKGQ